MRYLLLLFIVTTACGYEWPLNAEVDPPPNADKAIEIVIEEWDFYLGINLTYTPRIYWFEGPCLDYGDDDFGCMRGNFSYMPADLYHPEIHLVYEDKPSNTGLAHELLHWALYESGRDVGRDHIGPEWSYLAHVNERLTWNDL